MKLKKTLAFVLSAVCIFGAGLCIAMVVRAVQALEWGRVLLYGVCLVVCVECTVLIVLNLKDKTKD